MRPNSEPVFLYLNDRNVSKVSGVWKALHIAIYAAIAIISFVASMAAGNAFQTFKYNCVLFCTDIVFQEETFDRLPSIQVADGHEDFPNSTTIPVNVTELTDDITAPANGDNNVTSIFRNATHVIRQDEGTITVTYAKIDVRKSAFPTGFWCDFVLGIALISFVFATFSGTLLTMCSKGGRGRTSTLNRPQNLVYPMIFTSLLLAILNLVAAIKVKNGMDAFCANFEPFTNDQGCSPLVNQFTLHERQSNFYWPYAVLNHTFNLIVILFIGQTIVTLLRVIYAVDYQLYALEPRDEEEERDLEIEDGRIVRERKL